MILPNKECFCGNTPPAEEDLTKESDCNRKCPGDSSKTCGGSWKMNVYETGYESGLAMAPGRSCDCSYRFNQLIVLLVHVMIFDLTQPWRVQDHQCPSSWVCLRVQVSGCFKAVPKSV